MYELRKWVNKPVLKEVLYSNMNFQALEETIADITEKENISNEKEFFDLYEIEDLETGLMNNEVLIEI
ncbi:MAG: hypothetical protein E7Z78_09210 [Methanobrevibacter thaueri]|jgi:hypothetical protein|uniref:hypothetical protein n=1 Tax=Methanobrevibacter thaueri TaxID=190975 RepID=UPI0026F05AEA|nr:hypothetical protein [Methanobrevibacter thaueri]MBE6496606.1 hypothetical protein [Methanobrevibacter thaueri]